MSSKNSVNSKTSVGTTKVEPTKKSYYDEWRPPPGIRYQLSQTNVDFDAVVPKVKLEFTTVEYEPGQDRTVPETEETEKYAKQRGRGPVFIFQEEIDEAKRRKIQKEIIETVLRNCKKRQRETKEAMKGIHEELMSRIGPIWFHELSVKQMQSADSLKDAMLLDHKRETIINTQETLGAMGLVLWPNHTKVEYALKKFYLCPVEFLLTLFRLNRPKEEDRSNEYTLNDRIILSCVVHLTMRETLRELHLRIPSPPPSTEEVQPTAPKKKAKINIWKKVKWIKGMSPYLKPIIAVEQKHREGVYKNRHKEYASLEYFDYVEDMYEVYYEDDPESIKKRKQLKRMKNTRWNKPPSIPVRYIESKMKKKRVCQLKKPSPYISPCKKIKFKQPPEPEPEPESEPEPDNICCCSPQTFNENTTFNLKIKITTNEDEFLLTQKLCPYKSTNVIGDLNLVEQTKIVKDEEDEVICEEIEGESKPFKKIEYSCECCTCGKSVNIFPEEPSNLGVRNMNDIKQIMTCQGCLEPIPEEEDLQMYEAVDMDYEQSISEICKCKSRSDNTTSTDIDDPYYLCTCKSSSDACTCCICDKMDKDFLLRIKRYNQAFNTKHQPCLCACKCKKYKKPVCCAAIEDPCKYCFCKKKKEEPIPEEEEQEPEVVEEEKLVVQVEELSKPSVSKKPSKEDKKLSIRKTIDDIEQKKECECEKLYNKYIDAHESCMSLFANYQKKIEEDVADYLKDIKNRCLCGDSISSDDEGKYDEEEFQFLQDLKAEESSDSICICQKGKKQTCSCCNDSPDDYYAGCTCNPTGIALTGCTCNNTSSSSEESSSSESDNCCCACTCGQGPCKCEEFLLKVKEEKARLAAETEETLVGMSKKSLDQEPEDELSEEESEKVEEVDPRIMVLDKFPRKKKQQMKLLKTALAALAEDGYPLAKLPDVHILPHFQIWLNKRTRKYVSMKDRDNLYRKSKDYWNHIEICERKTAMPDSPLPQEQIHNVTWGGVNKYKNMIAVVKTDYNRRLKQNYINQAQELFPSMFHYPLPNKTFRSVYFSYLASDENHLYVFKPWELHERKDMSKRQPC